MDKKTFYIFLWFNLNFRWSNLKKNKKRRFFNKITQNSIKTNKNNLVFRIDILKI